MANKGNIRLVKVACTLGCILLCSITQAQRLSRLDSLRWDSITISHHKFINNIFQQAINSVKKSNDTNSNDLVLSGKSELPYMPYEGKIIRHIIVKTLDFSKSFSDTSSHINTILSKAANATHRSTREFVVRDNLFIQENTPVNAFKLADNERYLRTLDYIHDARIIIKKIPGNKDSVDILVVTQDFYSISADGASNGLNHIQTRLVDANLAGMGQRLEIASLYDYNRSPNWGYGALYRKDNYQHSFINATVGYSTEVINNYTRQENTSAFVILDRPLISPYSHFAGGATFSRNMGYNLYHNPDSIVYTNKYNYYDAWIGYNLAVNKLSENNGTIRDRRFLGVRYFNYHFTDVPYQVGSRFDPIFNSKQGVLAQLTFFRQDYYKTQYVYGFGTTEDLPYGYNIAVTTGWYKQLDLERPYAGIRASDYIATRQGDFIQLFTRLGGFSYKGNLQDISFMVGGTAYSRLYFWNQTKIRQFVMLSYSSLHNVITTMPLKIDNTYGIREFLSDSAYGSRRLSLQVETEFYLRYKVLGFQFAPFPYADISLVTPLGGKLYQTQLYSGLGGGIRARNENLIFETIELRAFYYPVAPSGMKGFKIILNSNIRYRYQSNYVTEPDIVQLNVEQ